MLARRFRAARSASRGFALMIALVLMGFMLLLLLSLSSLTAVETSAAANENLLAQARANARTALLIALGELQKTAGPDQRTTAAAVLGETVDNVSADASRSSAHGLVTPLPGARYWTGVWGTSTAPDDFSQNTDAVLLTWLVSGNETMDSIGTNADGSLSFSTARTIRYKPDGANGRTPPVPNTSAEAVDNFGDWSLLAGRHSVRDAEDFVFAPLVAIDTPSGTPGRYSWWVGDEGVKARFDLRDPRTSGNDPLGFGSQSDVQRRTRLAMAHRSGIERVSGLSDYAINDTVLEQVYSFQDVGNVVSNVSDSDVRRQFHHLTAYANGVLADARRGGLKEDLSVHFENGTTPADDLLPVINNDTHLRSNGPTWDVLRSFYDQLKANAQGTESVSQVAASSTQHGINPVLVQVRNSIRVFVNGGGETELHMAPLFVLGNPYNVPLRSGGLDIRYHTTSSDLTLSANEDTLKNRQRIELATDIPDVAQEEATWKGIGNEADILKSTGTPRFQILFFNPNNESENLQRSIFSNTVFRIPEFTLLPGQLMIFGLSNSVNMPDDNAIAVVELAEGVPNTNHSLRIPARNHPSYNFYYPGQDAGGVVPPDSLSTPPVFSPVFVAPETNHWSSRVIGSGDFFLSVFDAGQGEAFNPWDGNALLRLYNIGTLSVKPREFFDGPVAFNAYPVSPIIPRYFLELPDSNNNERKTYAHFNIRGQNARRPQSFFTTSSSQQNPLYSNTLSRTLTDFLKNIDRWGSSLEANGNDRAVLFNLKGVSEEAPMLSVGAFQHADLTVDAGGRSTTIQPGNAVGNSLAHPHVSRESVRHVSNAGGSNQTYYDISYILNQSLWGRYFFSTMPQNATAVPAVLPNNRMIALSSDTAVFGDAKEAAAHLLLKGAFNVNSVSVEAWKALLGAMRYRPSSAGEPEVFFMRSLDQPGGTNAGNLTDRYDGYRTLSDAQIDALAKEIVKEVRRRGPFVNLSQFVNRRLVASPNSGGQYDQAETEQSLLGLKGALQAAIDNVGDSERINVVVTSEADEVKATTGNYERFSYTDTNALLGNKHANAPGWLTQADVLQAIGPVLSSRSDTFIIRAYGDVLDPSTANTTDPKVLARAWCEAIVQRLPEPVVPSAAAPNEPDDNDWGRRFVLLGFRWLTPDEI